MNCVVLDRLPSLEAGKGYAAPPSFASRKAVNLPEIIAFQANHMLCSTASATLQPTDLRLQYRTLRLQPSNMVLQPSNV